MQAICLRCFGMLIYCEPRPSHSQHKRDRCLRHQLRLPKRVQPSLDRDPSGLPGKVTEKLKCSIGGAIVKEMDALKAEAQIVTAQHRYEIQRISHDAMARSPWDRGCQQFGP